MNRRGVCYDVGHVMGINWRPVFDVRVVHRELEIIRDDLHCNAVRIGGTDLKRVTTAAEDALGLGLEVWFSAVIWDRSPDDSLAYIERAAVEAERLRLRWPDQVVFVVGQELTLFMQGIVPGKTLMNRVKNPAFRESLMSGSHNAPLNAFLTRTAAAVRRVYHGPLTYASLPFETVDWDPFDIVGIDHYRAGPAKERYLEMLEPLFATGKPVVNTEFGMGTYVGADEKGMAREPGRDGRREDAIRARAPARWPPGTPSTGRAVRARRGAPGPGAGRNACDTRWRGGRRGFRRHLPPRDQSL
jgi:hypothetical protein